MIHGTVLTHRFVTAGVDLNIRQNDGCTAIEIAAYQQCPGSSDSIGSSGSSGSGTGFGSPRSRGFSSPKHARGVGSPSRSSSTLHLAGVESTGCPSKGLGSPRRSMSSIITHGSMGSVTSNGSGGGSSGVVDSSVVAVRIVNMLLINQYTMDMESQDCIYEYQKYKPLKQEWVTEEWELLPGTEQSDHHHHRNFLRSKIMAMARTHVSISSTQGCSRLPATLWFASTQQASDQVLVLTHQAQTR